MTTTLSAATASVSALSANMILTERMSGEAIYDLGYALNGALGGLVAITAGCTVVETWASLVIGFVGGLLFLGTTKMLEHFCLDDAVDAIPVHLTNGLWGCIAVGLLASPDLLQQVYGRSDHAGWFYEWSKGSIDGRLLAAQLVGLVFIMAWSCCIMYPFFTFIDFMGWFRSDTLEELVGLDISYHGGTVPEETTSLEYVEAMKVKKSMEKKGFFRRRKQTELQDLEVDSFHQPGGVAGGGGMVNSSSRSLVMGGPMGGGGGGMGEGNLSSSGSNINEQYNGGSGGSQYHHHHHRQQLQTSSNQDDPNVDHEA